MKRRRWDATSKAVIVLEGLQGKPVADICTEHQISQSQYYQWRDRFLAHAGQAFEHHQATIEVCIRNVYALMVAMATWNSG
jgi:transposase-like protein